MHAEFEQMIANRRGTEKSVQDRISKVLQRAIVVRADRLVFARPKGPRRGCQNPRDFGKVADQGVLQDFLLIVVHEPVAQRIPVTRKNHYDYDENRPDSPVWELLTKVWLWASCFKALVIGMSPRLGPGFLFGFFPHNGLPV